MGNGNSKVDESESPPKVVLTEPVNVMITQKVTERWEALALQKEQHLAEVKEADKPDANGTSSNSSIRPMEVEINQKIGKMPDCDGESKEDLSSTSVDQPTKNDLASMQRTTNDFPAVKEINEIVGNNDNMDKFANFFVPRNTLILRRDLENGGGDGQDPIVNSETGYSAFFQGSPEDDNGQVMHEEVNEMADVDRKSSSFIDEEAEIGRDNGTSSPMIKFNNKGSVKEVHVPRSLLPIVVDEDEEGKVTAETINAWKMRQQLGQEISKNDVHWTGELQRITAKIEDETRKEAADFQRRINELKKRYPEVTEPQYSSGAHCNLLVSQIGNCYKKNETEVLKCSELVRQFAKCTNKTV